LAAVLAADECQFYTDIDGMYATDLEAADSARRMDEIRLEEMIEKTGLGAKVL